MTSRDDGAPNCWMFTSLCCFSQVLRARRRPIVVRIRRTRPAECVARTSIDSVSRQDASVIDTARTYRSASDPIDVSVHPVTSHAPVTTARCSSTVTRHYIAGRRSTYSSDCVISHNYRATLGKLSKTYPVFYVLEWYIRRMTQPMGP